MKVHLVVDYSFLYYKYKFRLDSGKLRRLTAPVHWNGAVIEKDISQVYYSIREIESLVKRFTQLGHEVVSSICFDMPSSRSDNNSAIQYKSNRTHKLSNDDYENIDFVRSLLDLAGHNTYKFIGFEADDIVSHLVHTYKNEFDYTLIITPDLDLLVNISDNVGVSRYKASKGYVNVDINTFSSYIGQELKCVMPYNGIILYKSTVGDKSDCIKGIRGFGASAFNKLVGHLSDKGVDWKLLVDWKQVDGTLKELSLSGYFSQEQFIQAEESLSLVRPLTFEGGVVSPPIKCSTPELREQAYGPYGMKSLI